MPVEILPLSWASYSDSIIFNMNQRTRLRLPFVVRYPCLEISQRKIESLLDTSGIVIRKNMSKNFWRVASVILDYEIITSC